MFLEVGRAKSNNSTFSLVMCDIDKFKSVNDTFGHRKGDEILKKIGQTLSQKLRVTDLVGRYGGEEFVILLPMTALDEAFEVCEKVRWEIEDQKMLGSDFPLTMSFGISTYPDHGVGEEELLEKADQALYYSKNNGRNQTTLWNPNIGNEGVRFDKLAGILSGNISKDTRNVQAMVNVLTAIRELRNPEERALVFLNNVMDITEATQSMILIFDGFELYKWYGRDKGGQTWLESLNFDLMTLNEFSQKEQGEYYINWNDLEDVELESGIPKWKSVIFLPQRLDNGNKAVLLLTVPIAEKEFDFADFNFVSSMGGLLTTLL
jgi:diguanylate cyclase (GGDEF)-like protein